VEEVRRKCGKLRRHRKTFMDERSI
jgi:hypothetical protein